MLATSSPRINWPVVGLAALVLFGGALYIGNLVPGGKPLLYLLGGVMGLALYHAAFGFTSGWRNLVLDGRGAGMRAQLFTFAVAALLILPVLDAGEILGHGVVGAVAPVGIAMVLGAFVFGFGMQLGGGCASGTLYTVGGGSTRMVITLLFFMAGSVIGSAQLPWWFSTWRFNSGTLLDVAGLIPTLIITLGLLATLAWITVVIERRQYGNLHHGGNPDNKNDPLLKRLTRGPWPLLWGGLVLALGNFAVVAITGHTWSISFGYTLWGAKALGAVGIDLSQTEFWTWGYPARALAGSLFAEDTSVMNFGILFGAALAAGLAGKFGTFVKIPLKSVLAAALGGLLMGYGARLASGCNVGALFSGIASGSFHGWAWLVSGFIGSYLGIKARPVFRL
ncbi:Sulfur transporter [hydrothermal vent metagenome]|uniref:Sulfur transporter n=1 Tax=hydrothermal vent metagenome TaxID=652676 RepID=A0A3B0SIA2_9ZZZZ